MRATIALIVLLVITSTARGQDAQHQIQDFQRAVTAEQKRMTPEQWASIRQAQADQARLRLEAVKNARWLKLHRSTAVARKHPTPPVAPSRRISPTAAALLSAAAIRSSVGSF